MTTNAKLLADLDVARARLKALAGWVADKDAAGIDVVELLTGTHGQQPHGTGLVPGTLWCDDHERPVSQCRADDHDCDGVDVAQWMRRDSTGEAAVAEAAATRLLDRYVRAVVTTTDTLYRHVVAHQPRRDDSTRREALAKANEQHCESCARVRMHGTGPAGWPSPAMPPSDLGGIFERKRGLCGSCRDRCKLRAANGLAPWPTEAEVSERWHRYAGQRWPRLYEPARVVAERIASPVTPSRYPESTP